MRAALLSTAIAMTVLAGPCLALIGSPPRPGEPMLVVAPQGNVQRIVGAAGGALVGPLVAPMGALAASPSPRFAERLRANGAWMVLDGRAIAALCGNVT